MRPNSSRLTTSSASSSLRASPASGK
jgi:hypothetical protein